jgi:integrase
MNIRYYEKRPGAWHLDFRLADGTRVRPFGGTTEAEAKANAPRILAMAFNGPRKPPAGQTGPQGATMGEAYRKALRVREQWIRSKDKATLQTTFDAILATTGAGLGEDTPAAKLTRDFVRDLRGRWLQEPGKRAGTVLSPSTINHRLSMLSVLLEVADLPKHGVKHLSVRGNRRTRRISDAEYGAALDWFATHGTRRGAAAMGKLVQLAWHTAARQGELLGLQWADVGPSVVTLRDTKNGDTRTVPLTPAAEAVLESRKHLTAPFADLTQAQAVNLWSDMRHALGLATDDEFVFHALRHERISRWIDEGASPFTVQALAGHSSITTTQVYHHASLAAMARVVNPQGAQQ